MNLLLLCLGCNSTKNIKSQPNELNGTWVPVYQEMGGKELPASFYEKQKLIISDSTYMVIAESVDKGIIKFSGSKMDIYGNEGINAGKHITVLYKYENEKLTICYNLSGNSYPETFETKSNSMFFLSEFRKGLIK